MPQAFLGAERTAVQPSTTFKEGPGLLHRIQRLSRAQLIRFCLLLVAVIGVGDYLTGVEVIFILLYLLPVSLSTWFGGRTTGIAFAALCTGVYLALNLLSRESHLTVIAMVWNSGMEFGVFLSTVLALTALAKYLRIRGALHKAASSLTTLALDDVLANVLEAATEAIPESERGSILLWNEDRDALCVKQTFGYADPRVKAASFSKASGCAERCAREGPFVIEDARADPETRYDGDIDEFLSVQSAVLAPLIVRSRSIGVISLVSTRPRVFTHEHLDLLTAFAGSAAIAIDHSRLYNDLEKRVEQRTSQLSDRERQQAAVARLGQEALENIDFDALLGKAVNLLAQTLGVDYAVVLELLPHEGELLVRAGVGRSPGFVGHSRVGLGEKSQAGYVLQSKRPVIVEDLSLETRFKPSQLFLDQGIVSGISVSIHGRDRPLGVLSAQTTRRRHFDDDDIHFLESIANVIATVRARQLAEEETNRFFDLSVEMLCIIGDGHFKRVNAAWQKTLGYTRAELLSRPVKQFIHPDDRLATEDVERKLLSNQQSVLAAFENRYRCKDGSYRWLAWNARLGPDRELIYAATRDVSETRRLLSELHELSLRDPLTGLYNRRGFTILVEQQLRLAERAAQNVLAFVIDVDDFKKINDALGHEEGDWALVRIAKALRKTFRASDILARLGGDEFVVLAIEPTLLDVEATSRRIHANLAMTRSPGSSGALLPLSVTIGAARYNPLSMTSVRDLIAAADRSMYVEKRKKAISSEDS